MANPQKENGNTQLANEILDALCRFRMPGEVRQIVDTVIRQTYGWHKIWDKISNSQFVAKTGLKKANVSRSLSKAITHQLVIQSDNGFRFNKDHEQWVSFKSLSKVITGTKNQFVIQNATAVIQSDNKSLSKVMDTKESKTTITKENTIVVASPHGNPELNQLIEESEKLSFPIQGSKAFNRRMAWNLLRQRGLGVSIKLVKAAIGCRGKEFAPVVNDFAQLYRKQGDIVNFYAKKEAHGKRGIRL